MRDTANTKLLAGGAVGAAIAASVCCIGPLLLALLGLGGGALLVKLEPYRPYFLAATGSILAGAFYVTYRRAPAEHCEPGTACGPGSRRGKKVVLWIVTGIVLLLAAFPYYSKYLL